jgi:molybdopterin-guanine dinucleotide biosynthesis protein A
MKKNKKNINGYILAGGKSSRMGTDKGLLFLNGKLIIQTIIEQLQPAVNKTIIVSNNAEYKKFGLEVIPDLIKDKGPAGGILTALSHTASERIFVVSCDMPFITTDAIQFMIEQSVHSQITLPVYHSELQPLFGVYSKNCLPLWQRLIEKGMIKLQEMVTHFELKKIAVEKNELFVDLLFTNINDENDFKQALKNLQHGN